MEDMHFFLCLIVISIYFNFQLPLLVPNMFLFLKSSRTCVLLLLHGTPFTSVIVLQWHHEAGNFFSEYNQSTLLFYIGYYLEVSSSLLYVQEHVHY
jgi:hypothetical protein